MDCDWVHRAGHPRSEGRDPGHRGAVLTDTAAGEIVVACDELAGDLEFFTDLGFRLDQISPADSPLVALLSGYGLTLRLDAERESGSPATIRLPVGAGDRLVAPSGAVIERVDREPPIVLPPVDLSIGLELTRATPEDAFGSGRAGMTYRDLLPRRQGGRVIASHIRIADGGPVADYVHFHRIRYQLIYCLRGWVRLVYEDQGPPFVLEAGDCVLQPPEIRHRVLESSPGLEVVEVGSPARHATVRDHDLPLPTGARWPERDFGGQRFIHHVAAAAEWSTGDGLRWRDLGLADASAGVVGARVVQPDGVGGVLRRSPSDDFHFLFVVAGTAALSGESDRLGPGDACALPEDGLGLSDLSDDFEALEVSSHQ